AVATLRSNVAMVLAACGSAFGADHQCKRSAAVKCGPPREDDNDEFKHISVPERKLRMSKIASILVCGVFASILASEAQAIPIAPAPVKPSEILQVRGFCGLGFHRDVYGYCVRNGVPYGYV